MFPAFCRQVVSEVGKDTLKPSPSIDESKHLLPLNVVTMREKRKFFVFSSVETSTHDSSLTDLLTDHDELVETKLEELSCCSINIPGGTYSRNMKIGADVNGIIDASASANDNVEMNVKLGKLLCEEIRDTSFVNALKKRRLDTNHPLIEQIKETNTVLCVVKGVIKTSQKAEFTLKQKNDWKLKLKSKVAANIGAAATGFQTMDIEKGTILAYKIWKLNVYLDSGKMDPIMTKYDSGGFFKSGKEEHGLTINQGTGGGKEEHGLTINQGIGGGKEEHGLTINQGIGGDADVKASNPQFSVGSSQAFGEGYRHSYDTEVKASNPQFSVGSSQAFGEGYRHSYETEKKKRKLQDSPETGTVHNKARGCSPMKDEDPLKNLKEILQPLRDCIEADGQPIKSSLLALMTYSRDVSALSKILSKAEHGCLNEDKDILDKHFINNDTVWYILKGVGVQTEKGRVLYEGKATAILIAVAYMIDAILEIDNDDLDTIYHCDEPQLKTLSNIFESAITSSKTIFMPSVLTRSAYNFLAGLGFRVSKDSTRIIPPKVKTCVAECIFCVLYCLSS